MIPRTLYIFQIALQKFYEAPRSLHIFNRSIPHWLQTLQSPPYILPLICLPPPPPPTQKKTKKKPPDQIIPQSLNPSSSKATLLTSPPLPSRQPSARADLTTLSPKISSNPPRYSTVAYPRTSHHTALRTTAKCQKMQFVALWLIRFFSLLFLYFDTQA